MNQKLSRRVVAQTIAARLLAEPARRNHWLKVLAAYLVEQKLIDDIDLFVNDLARELFLQDGHLLADVTSARPLTAGLRSDLARMLKQSTGATRVELNEKIDKGLVGGFIARTPDGAVDQSVRTKLTQLGAIS